MNSLYKILGVTTSVLVATSLAAAGTLVLSMKLGFTGFAWALWYFTLFCTPVAIVMAVITTTVFLVGYYKKNDQRKQDRQYAVYPRDTIVYG